jgi:hypothetical protein
MASLLPNGYDPQNLNDVLQQQAQSASANQNQNYIQQKRQAIAQEGAGGRLLSGVSNYPLSDLSTWNQQNQSGIQDQLASSLAGIPEEDWLNTQNFQRQTQLAQLIGSLNKPSSLQEALGAIGQVGPLAAMTASFL